MGSSCFSLISLIAAFLRRSFTAAGLSPQAAAIDGDTTIHFWGPAAATSKPKLVLIHGFGPSGVWQWRQQAAFFAREYDVYVPDLVFFGESFTRSSARSEVFQATCLARLMENLGVKRYSVVGTSYGGFVAYRMAEMWPERVEKVVIASSAVNMRRSDNARLLKEADVDKIEDLLLPVTAGQLRSALRFVVTRAPYVPDFFLNDFIDKLYSENRKEKVELLKELNIGKFETVNLSPLSQEVLIVWGENDQIFLLEKAEELKKYSVVGNSYGGFVAYRMAEMWPERVEKVVIASSAVNMRRSDNEQMLKEAGVDKIEDLLLPVTPGQLRSSLRLVMSRRPLYMPDFVLNDFIDKLYSQNRREKLELLRELSIGQNETITLTPLSQEVLIVWGENDQIFPLDKAEELKKFLGEKAILQVIQNGSHVPQLEHAGQFNNIVNNFLHGLS